MIVDTSAILAVLSKEPLWKGVVEKLSGAGVVGDDFPQTDIEAA